MNDEDSAHRLARVLAYSKVITERMDTSLARVLRAKELLLESPGMRGLREVQQRLPPHLALIDRYETQIRERVGEKQVPVYEESRSVLQPVCKLIAAPIPVPLQQVMPPPVQPTEQEPTAKTWRIHQLKRIQGYAPALLRVLPHFQRKDPYRPPTARNVLEYWRATVKEHPEIAQVNQDDMAFYDGNGDIKTASLESIRGTIGRVLRRR